MQAPLPDNEDARLQALRDYEILDTAAEAEFDDFTTLAAHICGTPIALISLIDADRQWFKSRVGVDAHETPRDVAFCAHAIQRPGVFMVPDAQADARFADNPFVTGETEVRFYAGAPLLTDGGHALGTLCVIDHVPRTLTVEQESALQALARQVIARLDLRRHLTERQKAEQEIYDLHAELSLAYQQTLNAYDATIAGWSLALECRDHETEGHSHRVTELTLWLARAMGMCEADLVHVRRGALLHDIGKMGVPDRVLLKPGPLDDAEWDMMRRHPTLAHEMLAPVAFLRPALDIPYCHHEKWDGTGYPQGLAGEDIPLAARMFAIVDVWDALRSDRPYRKAWPCERVLDHIRGLSGTHFDPQVVAAFLDLMNEGQGRPTGAGRPTLALAA